VKVTRFTEAATIASCLEAVLRWRAAIGVLVAIVVVGLWWSSSAVAPETHPARASPPAVQVPRATVPTPAPTRAVASEPEPVAEEEAQDLVESAWTDEIMQDLDWAPYLPEVIEGHIVEVLGDDARLVGIFCDVPPCIVAIVGDLPGTSMDLPLGEEGPLATMAMPSSVVAANMDDQGMATVFPVGPDWIEEEYALERMNQALGLAPVGTD